MFLKRSIALYEKAVMPEDGISFDEITVTFFDNIKGRRKVEKTISWPHLKDEILCASAASKPALPLLKLARFGELPSPKGSLRHDENLVEITGIEADYDGETIPPTDALLTLKAAGIKAMLYTTPSHTVDKPRWRILCPTSKPLAPNQRLLLMARLNGVLGGVLADESFTLSQASYYGHIRNQSSFFVDIVDGRPIDICKELDEGRIGKTSSLRRLRNMPIERVNSESVDKHALTELVTSGLSYHQASLSLIGGMAKDDVPIDQAKARLLALYDAIAVSRQDKRWSDRRADAPRCVDDIYRKEAARKIRRQGSAAAPVAGNAGSSTSTCPTIQYTSGQIGEIVDKAEDAFLARRIGVYQRGTLLVRPGHVGFTVRDGRQVKSYRILEIEDHTLVEIMTHAAHWERLDGRTGRWERIDAPMKAAITYRQRKGHWRVPFLSAVINAPTLRSDGSVLEQPGYDAATGLLFVEPEAPYPAVPSAPSRQDALAALRRLEELLKGFPFVDRADRSVAFSCILSACIRRSLPTVPLHGFTAPTPGSGKSFLVDVVCLIAAGREAAVMAQGGGNEELEKRLGAHLLAGDAVIAIDNCEVPLGCEFLCTLLTQQTVRTRILGKSEAPELPSNALITATGNNLQLEGDMARRALLCQLDPQIERPELRSFEFDPAKLVKENRGSYLVDALTILHAYHLAGRPGRPSPLASFEMWSDWVRGALIWLNQADPVETMEQVRKQDPKRNLLVAVMEQWAAIAGCRDISVAELVNLAEARVGGRPSAPGGYGPEQYLYPELRDALLGVAGKGGDLNSYRLGRFLAANKGRLIAGYRIVEAGVTNGVRRWRLEGAQLPC